MTIGSFINDVSALLGAAGLSYRGQLQSALWKGVPFGVTTSRARFGRRNVVHDYPNRDAPWVEDLGRGRQVIHIVGFLLGDDVIAQSKRMAAVCQQRDSDDQGGELVHPQFGRNRFSLLDFAITHTIEGRFAELEFSFVNSTPRIYPVSITATPQETLAAADDADSAAADSFGSRIAAALQQGAAVVQSVVGTVQQYGGQAFSLVADATSLFRTVQALPGEFGRFFDGASATLLGVTGDSSATSKPPKTVSDLIASGAQSRANATAAVSAAQSSAASLSASTTADLGAKAQAVMATLGSATSDPADRVRIFQVLATFVPLVSQGSASVATAQSATSDLWRRAAVSALARATAAYQPASQDDAATVRDAVVTLLDAEIDTAGDQGEDSVFSAFRALKAAVVADMNARGAGLPRVITVSFAAPLPAPLIAMKLYQDASRADELIAEADVVHPGFMPTSFRALAS